MPLIHTADRARAGIDTAEQAERSVPSRILNRVRYVERFERGFWVSRLAASSFKTSLGKRVKSQALAKTFGGQGLHRVLKPVSKRGTGFEQGHLAPRVQPSKPCTKKSTTSAARTYRTTGRRLRHVSKLREQRRWPRKTPLRDWCQQGSKSLKGCLFHALFRTSQRLKGERFASFALLRASASR